MRRLRIKTLTENTFLRLRTKKRFDTRFDRGPHFGSRIRLGAALRALIAKQSLDSFLNGRMSSKEALYPGGLPLLLAKRLVDKEMLRGVALVPHDNARVTFKNHYGFSLPVR
ncbi:MAG: hypothetical protein WC030_03790 [Candidatus Paceibacterota bacterium]